MIFSKASLLAVLGVATAIQYASAFNTRNRDALIPRQTSTTANDYSTEYWFDQLIDHANPSAGTFKQRYFFSDQYYKGQGAPIVIGTPGEQSADGSYSDLTGASMMNWMMQSWGAAGVVLEHRYWGKSSPYTTLTAPSLQNLTVQQAIEDDKYFAETVVLPWAAGAYTTTPISTPWVNIGDSYLGLLVGSVQQQGISEIRGWLENWYAAHPGVTNTLATPGKLVIAARANAVDNGDEAADDVDDKGDGLDDNTADAAAVDDEDDQPDGTDPTADANALDDEDDEDDEGDQPDGSDPNANADVVDDEDDEDDEGDQPDGTDPTADGTDPTADGTDPTADGTDPTADGNDPTANANANALDDEDDEVDQPDGTDPTANANANALDDEDDEDDEGDQPDGTDPTANANALDDEDDEDDEGDQPDGTDPTANANANALDDEDDEDDEGDQPDGTDPTADAAAVDDEDDEDDEGDQPDGSDPNANADVVDDEDDEDDEGDQPDGTDPTADGTDPNANDPNATDDVDDEEDGPSSNPNTASVEVVDDDDDDTLNSIATDAGTDNAATGEIQTNGNNNNNNSELQDKINQLAANKKLTVASFIVNGVLALVVIGCLVLLFLSKRKANKSKSTPALPRWVGGKDGVHEGDQLGEYGTGRRAGGRGQYKTLEEQTH